MILNIREVIVSRMKELIRLSIASASEKLNQSQ